MAGTRGARWRLSLAGTGRAAAAVSLAVSLACTSRAPAPQAKRDDGKAAAASLGFAPFALTGTLPGGRTVTLDVDESGAPHLRPTAELATASAPFLSPPIIDSHVHLAYWPIADQLRQRGVLVAVDLAAPLDALEPLRRAPIEVRFAGPMLTSPGGYPLDSWGRDGYGLACADQACVKAAVAELAHRGATVLKIAVDPGGLSPDLVEPAVRAAHHAGLRVAVHALSDDAAARAASAGADLLAHTPTEPLAPSTVELWRGRAVISTLAAFGGSAAAVDNLRKLRAAGATVLYGTDLGNLRDAGPSEAELGLLRRAGLDDAALTAAMTTAPARYWKLAEDQAFLVLAADPERDARALLAPLAVIQRGFDSGMRKAPP